MILELVGYGAAVPFGVAAAFAIWCAWSQGGWNRGAPAAETSPDGANSEAAHANDEAGSATAKPQSAETRPSDQANLPSTGEGTRGWLRGLPAAAMACAFFAAYLLLPWAPLQPTSEWHWLPWLLVGGGSAVAIIAWGFGSSAPSALPKRAALWLVPVVLAMAGGWLLVPDWSDLQETRPAHVAGLAAALLTVLTVSELSGRRLRASIYFAGWSGPTVAAAGLLAHSGNLKFAQLEAVLAAATAAWFCAGLARRQLPTAGAAMPLAVAHGGLLYLGWMYSFSAIPFASYALLAAAPALMLVAARRSWLALALPVAAVLTAWALALWKAGL